MNHEPEVELPAYRFQINESWHVAVLSPTRPPEENAKEFEDFLSQGESVTPPSDILKVLLERRKKGLSPGRTWFEGHH